MFKSILVIFAVAAAIAQIEGLMTMDEAREVVVEMGKTCVAEIGATADDFADLKSYAPKSKGAKCLAACLYKNFGIIKDGKYNMEGAIAASKMVHEEDSAQHQNLKEIVTACGAAMNDPDECELAAKVMICVMPKFDATGVEVPF